MRIFADHERLSQEAAAFLTAEIELAASRSGRALLCLCGGTTPPRTYALLAQAALPWERVHIFWGDERWRGEEGNHHDSVRDLFAGANLHPYPLEESDPPAAARRYERHLREFFGTRGPRFDVAVQGLGDDGHTASLFPGTAGLLESTAWVTSHHVPAKGRWRLTLTYPALEHARKLLFLVSGSGKQEALAAVLRGDDLPATRLIRRENALIYCDEAAVR